MVTIPNGTVLGGVVVNYSAEAKQKGVIFHTTVTIGYNAPWRKVHDLLLAAALATDDVLHDPPPFVLQTALNDFYVAYELNAYTAAEEGLLLGVTPSIRTGSRSWRGNSPHYTSLRTAIRPPSRKLAQRLQVPVLRSEKSRAGARRSRASVDEP